MPNHRRTLVLLTTFATFSGAAALAYELLWARLLALTFGASHYAVTTVLAAFMLGLGFGSHVGGRFADRLRRPAAALLVVEAALVVLGPLLSEGLLRLPSLAAVLVPDLSITSAPAVLVRFLLALVLMLPATILMGASFPLLARSVGGAAHDLHRALPWLYGMNTIGGVFGVIGASFWLLPHHGVYGVVAGAVLGNLVAAGLALLVIQRTTSQPGTDEKTPNRPVPTALLMLSAASGCLVLASETLWNRTLSIILPNSTYTFALLLGLFLTGLGLGGLAAARSTDKTLLLRTWAWLQAALAFWTLVSISLLPHLSSWVRVLRPDDGWGRVLLAPVTIGAVLILPAALLLGAAWPVLLSAATPRTEDGGRRIGALGLANSIGAAAGAAIAGWLVLPMLGFGRSLLVVAAAHLTLAAVAWRRDRPMWAKTTAAAALLLIGIAATIPPFASIALPSTVDRGPDAVTTLLFDESPTGTVTVLEDRRLGQRLMYVDNSSVIGTTFDALKVARMLGLLPVVLHHQPEDVLVIGYGAGVTTSMLVESPSVKNVAVREIVPAVAHASRFFSMVNHDALTSPKVHLGFGDGRNYLQLTNQNWDVITCDPIHPLYGSAALYSLDFFRLCGARLKPGGLVCQYLPLHQMPPANFRQAIFTFSEAFSHTRVAFSLGHGVLIGSDEPIKLDWDRWSERLTAFPHQADLIDSVLQRPAQIAALMQLDTEACLAVGRGPVSSDRRPFLEFLEPAAYEKGVWTANAQTLIENYAAPLDDIVGLPRSLIPDLQRLIAGKRLLLFSQLARNDRDSEQARMWLAKAVSVAGDDPEIRRFSEQGRAEGWFR